MISRILCPICNSESHMFIQLDAKFIIKNLENDYQEKIPDGLDIVDYSMYKCTKCTLVFSSPLEHGSDNFYKWLTKHSGYYAINRWEWGIIFDKIKRNKIKSILEVGCGTGIFLKKCKDAGEIKVVGLDTDKDSINTCKEKGIEAYCETVEEYSTHSKERFDLVVSFHCLEHVDNPKTFIKSQLTLLNKNGEVLASTPYTTTPGEQWYETLNFPPHHMTQWNQTSYNELARQLNLNLRLFMPKSRSLTHRIINSLHLMYNGVSNNKKYSHRKRKIVVVFHSLLNPIKTIKEIHRHFHREKITAFNLENGNEVQRHRTVDYVILVELSNK